MAKKRTKKRTGVGDVSLRGIVRGTGRLIKSAVRATPSVSKTIVKGTGRGVSRVGRVSTKGARVSAKIGGKSLRSGYMTAYTTTPKKLAGKYLRKRRK